MLAPASSLAPRHLVRALARRTQHPGRVPRVPIAASFAESPPTSCPYSSTARVCHPASPASVGPSGCIENNDSGDELSRRFYLNRVLEEYASKPATPISLRQLIFFGKGLARDKDRILQSAEWVRKELPIRIAHRLRDLQALPFVVMSNPHLESVYKKYFSAFEGLRRFPPIRSIEDNEKFVEQLKWHLSDHLTVIPSLALGMVETSHLLAPAQLDGFMERMLRSRISRRVLAEQHIALSDSLDDPFHFFPESSSGEGGMGSHIGIIYTHLSPASVVRKSARLLRDLLKKEMPHIERMPPVAMDGNLDCQFSYIPEHLEYVIFELLKNAMRATLRRPVSEWDDPPILVTIVEGPPEEDLVIRISDSGGGIPDALVNPPIPGPAHPASQPFQSFAAAPPQPLPAEPSLANVIADSSDLSVGAHSVPIATLYARAQAAGQNGYVPFDSLQAAYRPTLAPVSSQDSPAENLLDALCSFSNVQRRFETQAVAAAAAAANASASAEGAGSEDEISGAPNAAVTATAAAGASVSAEGGVDQGLGSFNAHSGLSSVDRLEALKRTRKFKGTVGEQVRSAAVPPAAAPSSASHSSGSRAEGDRRGGKGSSGAASKVQDTDQVYSVRTDTGLGLPMSRAYCEFFGGSLNVRSCIGHSTDVFVRLPKLGTRKEQIEEKVVL